jgi:hypothetical protein
MLYTGCHPGMSLHPLTFIICFEGHLAPPGPLLAYTAGALDAVAARRKDTRETDASQSWLRRLQRLEG